MKDIIKYSLPAIITAAIFTWFAATGGFGKEPVKSETTSSTIINTQTNNNMKLKKSSTRIVKTGKGTFVPQYKASSLFSWENLLYVQITEEYSGLYSKGNRSFETVEIAEAALDAFLADYNQAKPEVTVVKTF